MSVAEREEDQGQTALPGAGISARGAWTLTRRRAVLILWLIGGDMVSVVLSVAVFVVLAGAMLWGFVAALEQSPSWWQALPSLVERWRSPGWTFGTAGLLASAVALWLAVLALVRSAVMGALAQDLRAIAAPSSPRQSGLRAVADRFAKMVGYTALWGLVDVAQMLFALVVVAWPVTAGVRAVLTQGETLWPWLLLSALGGAAALCFVGMTFLWRMVQLGPLLFDGQGLVLSLRQGAQHLGQNLGSYLRLLWTWLAVVGPIWMLYGLLSGGLALVSVGGRWAMLLMLARMAVDLIMAVVMALVSLWGLALFLVHYTRLEGVITQVPQQQLSRVEAPVARAQPGFAPGGGVVALPLPPHFDHVFKIKALFPHLDVEREDVDEAVASTELALAVPIAEDDEG